MKSSWSKIKVVVKEVIPKGFNSRRGWFNEECKKALQGRQRMHKCITEETQETFHGSRSKELYRNRIEL